jgi:hypothetical protein
MSDSRSQQDAQGEEHLAENSSREYQAMVGAIAAMEDAFDAGSVEKRRAWKQRVSRALALVVGLLQEHCELAEQRGGLVAEVELKLGRSDDITEARREHNRIVREAVRLLATLDEQQDDETPDRRELRRRARGLTAALRRHAIRQAGLLIEEYGRDPGGESGES